MPIYTAQNSDQCYRVFDANGLEWKDVVMVNTDTGDIEFFERGPRGEVLISKEGEIARNQCRIATPVSMVPTGERKDSDNCDAQLS